MKKKVVAMIAVVGLMSNMCIAYGSTTESEALDSGQIVESAIEESGENVTQGVQNEPEMVYEVSDDSLVIEDINGDSGEYSGVSELEEVEEVVYEKVVVTTGSCIFGDMREDIDEYASMDFPGSFEINPYAGRMKGTQVDVINTGETELMIIAEACYRNDYNSPEVVSRDKFSNWANLNVEETASNIAFGFIVRDENGEKLDTFWFEGEEDQKPEVVYVLEPDEHVTLEITGKHGMSWLKACTLSYDCIVGFEVIPTEKLVKQEIVKETIEEEIVNSEDKEVTEEPALNENDMQEELVDKEEPVLEEQENNDTKQDEESVEVQDEQEAQEKEDEQSEQETQEEQIEQESSLEESSESLNDSEAATEEPISDEQSVEETPAEEVKSDATEMISETDNENEETI